MTEYWQSKSRHYCSVCNCWLESNPRSIRAHEEGKQHKESSERHRKKQRDQKEKESVEHDALQRQLDQIEKAAQVSYLKHDTSSASKDVISQSTSQSKSLKRSRDDTHLMPASPWQTALDRTTNMPYYFHPITQQTTWNINDTFVDTIPVQQPDNQSNELNHIPLMSVSSSDLSHEHDSLIPSESTFTATTATTEEEELDEMGLPKFEPVDIDSDNINIKSISTNEVSSDRSHNIDQISLQSSSSSSRSIDTAALAALPPGLFKKRKKT